MINEHTDRMHLKRFNKNHGNLIYQLDSDPDVMKYITLGIPRTKIEAQQYLITRIMKSYKKGDAFGIFAAYLNSTNEYIGWFLFELDKEFSNAIEIGWRLKKEFWGNGYATEMAMYLVEKAKSMHKDVVARTMIENKASIRVMEKAGLKFVEEFWGDYNPHSGNPDVLYKNPLN